VGIFVSPPSALAELRDADGGQRVTHGDFRPNGVERRGLGHKLTGMINQIEQHVEGLAP
jgi:hypothetical protein